MASNQLHNIFGSVTNIYILQYILFIVSTYTILYTTIYFIYDIQYVYIYSFKNVEKKGTKFPLNFNLILHKIKCNECLQKQMDYV